MKTLLALILSMLGAVMAYFFTDYIVGYIDETNAGKEIAPTVCVTGVSMGQWPLSQKLPENCYFIERKDPTAGDIIAFECLDNFCDTYNENPAIKLSKRLTQIRWENGKKCYYVQGDNPDKSETWDSEDYGCIPEEKIHIKGVVILDK